MQSAQNMEWYTVINIENEHLRQKTFTQNK